MIGAPACSRSVRESAPLSTPATIPAPARSPDSHPAEGASAAHELYLMCDDIDATMAELAARGAEFTTPVRQAGFGRATAIRIPGGGQIGLYQPSHKTAYDA